MPVTTDPLTMSQAPSKEYLQGWNDCHKRMAEEIVRQDTQIEQYDLTIRGMTEKNDELREAGRKSADDAASALDLLSRIRFALGDNGTRMQDELLEYCRELRDSAGALAALGEEYDALKGRVAELEDLLISVTPEKDAEGIILNAKQKLGGEPGDSLIHLCIKTKYERDRYRSALEKIADCAIIPPSMTGQARQARQLMNWQDDARKALNP